MEKRRLHLQGPALSPIVAGAWRWNGVDISKLIETCLHVGITSFDHADIYGDYENEKIFGEALKKTDPGRQNVQLVTKCGIKLLSAKHPQTYVKHYDTSRQHIFASVENSLRNLRTDYLDLLLLHRPDPLMNCDEVAEAFGLLKQNGKVLHFGVSNFTGSQFEMLQSYLPFPLVTNQLEISLSKPDSLYDGTVDVLTKYRCAPMAWSPLRGGKLLSSHAGLWSQKEKYNATETQLSLAWLMTHPSGIFPVIGTTQPDRIIEGAKAVDLKLNRQDWFEMLKAAAGKDVA